MSVLIFTVAGGRSHAVPVVVLDIHTSDDPDTGDDVDREPSERGLGLKQAKASGAL